MSSWVLNISVVGDSSSGQPGTVLDNHFPQLDLLQYINAFLVVRSPKVDTVIQVQAQKYWTYYLGLVTTCLLIQPEAIPARGEPLTNKDSPASFLQICFLAILYCCRGLFQPWWKTSQLFLLNSIRFLSACFSNLSTSQQKAIRLIRHGLPLVNQYWLSSHLALHMPGVGF